MYGDSWEAEGQEGEPMWSSVIVWYVMWGFWPVGGRAALNGTEDSWFNWSSG